MKDLSATIKPKSDQLNADDLIAGPLTVTVQGVHVNENAADQPISVFIGDQYQPYKPCKSMRRLLIAIWGKHDSDWIGKSMTLYNDQSVQWAGKAVGGIRISHVSGITKPFNVALTATRGQRKPYTVQPLIVKQQQTQHAQQQATLSQDALSWLGAAEEAAGHGTEAFAEAFKAAPANIQAELDAAGHKRRLWATAKSADAARPAPVAPVDDLVNPASLEQQSSPTMEEVPFNPEEFGA